uniref:Uncharacterized protein n=1 Tax=Cyprinus carpio TaxID=7962 RepID=A0A8C1K891_CYPCA
SIVFGFIHILSVLSLHVSYTVSPDDQCKLVLSCLVTGFYPRDIKMNIRLNHKEFYDCFVIHSTLYFKLFNWFPFLSDM